MSFARCADVSLDSGFGILSAAKIASQSVRLLVTLLPTDEDEVNATPHGLAHIQKGLLWAQRARQERVCLRTSGIAANVQWLLTTPINATFL